MCSMLFSSFLSSSLHEYDVKPSNAMFYEERELLTNFPFCF